jgi:hypothetical protein
LPSSAAAGSAEAATPGAGIFRFQPDPHTLQHPHSLAKKTFEFASVHSHNLEQKWYPVKQATVEFEVTGADDPQALQRLIDRGNEQIQRWLDAFKDEADGLLDDFAKQEMKKAERIEASATATASTLKWVISVAWTAYQGVYAVKDLCEGKSPRKIVDGIKGFVDALNDLQRLAVYVQDLFADERTVRTEVKAGFKSTLDEQLQAIG